MHIAAGPALFAAALAIRLDVLQCLAHHLMVLRSLSFSSRSRSISQNCLSCRSHSARYCAWSLAISAVSSRMRHAGDCHTLGRSTSGMVPQSNFSGSLYDLPAPHLGQVVTGSPRFPLTSTFPSSRMAFVSACQPQATPRIRALARRRWRCGSDTLRQPSQSDGHRIGDR